MQPSVRCATTPYIPFAPIQVHPAAHQNHSFSIAASAAPASGFLLVSLSKMTRFNTSAALRLAPAASFPIKASDNPGKALARHLAFAQEHRANGADHGEK